MSKALSLLFYTDVCNAKQMTHLIRMASLFTFLLSSDPNIDIAWPCTEVTWQTNTYAIE